MGKPTQATIFGALRPSTSAAVFTCSEWMQIWPKPSSIAACARPRDLAEGRRGLEHGHVHHLKHVVVSNVHWVLF